MTSTGNPFPADGPFRPLTDGVFRFACHPAVPCFNQCCADLNLVLTPYDVLRLKNRLGMTSDEFLETHTRTDTEARERFPRIQLKMTDDPGRPCPFVTPSGCSIYEDRPGACRTYPLGRGAAPGGREMFFLVQEDHCQGFKEERDWKVDEWLVDQGLDTYNQFNDRWMEILKAKTSLGPQEHMVKKLQMFSMVSYNLDRFRAFVFQSRFLDMFDLPPETVASIKNDDQALLELGLDWLRFALYGEKVLPLRSAG